MFFGFIAAEIKAWCGGHAGFLQQVLGQREAVLRQCGRIAIQIEGPFGAGGDAETDAFQRRGKEVTAATKLGASGFEEGDGFRLESGQSSVLGRRGWA